MSELNQRNGIQSSLACSPKPENTNHHLPDDIRNQLVHILAEQHVANYSIELTQTSSRLVKSA